MKIQTFVRKDVMLLDLQTAKKNNYRNKQQIVRTPDHGF